MSFISNKLIVRRLQKASRPRWIALVVTAVAVTTVIGFSMFANQTSTASRTTNTNAAAGTKKIANSGAQTAQQLIAEQAAAAARTSSNKPTSTPAVAAPAAAAKTDTTYTGPKYSTSSDPRSTAYSATPPAPNAASFTKTITRNNQYPAGTMIYNNVTKGERGFYGGDLIVDKSSVTISRSNYLNRTIVITTPGGITLSAPGQNWADRGPVGVGAIDMPYPGPGSSFTMSILLNNYDIVPGTYTLHLHTSRDNQDGDAVYYDYLLPVTVTD